MPYGVEGMWAAGVQLFVLARLRALRRRRRTSLHGGVARERLARLAAWRGCGRRVYRWGWVSTPYGVETSRADVSTWGSCSRLFEYAFGVGACVGCSG